MPQLNSEDAKAKNKAVLAISPESETFTWQVNPNLPRVCRLLAHSWRLRVFVVHVQFRSLQPLAVSFFHQGIADLELWEGRKVPVRRP